MKNREIYQNDPTKSKLANDGVANVNDEPTSEAMGVLRSELETFVCDGQYAKGLVHVLETYLGNINQVDQPAVWVSGFFGSGKSHLVKMLRALWVDTRFSDGASARGIARLTPAVSDLLRELSAQGRRHGGLFAASGTLGASSRDKSVRLALLSVIFRAAGLPESYPRARFVMWLKTQGILEEVRELLRTGGYNFDEEIDNLFVAEGLHRALTELRPALFPSPEACVGTLNNQYPETQDVSNDEMLKAIRAALTRDGKLPLSLVVLDEVQQYIGLDPDRSRDVQEVVETCSKQLGGKLLFVATGQTAVTGTPELKKLEGRFTVRVELSDADVEGVIRQVVLAKKPEATSAVTAVLESNLGEISRHLAGTSIAHRQDDVPTFVPDYPVLPVRRRFWENTLRVLDRTGTESQLRNQLSMIHHAIQSNLEAPVGNVLPADFLYFDSAVKLLQSRLLPRKLYDKTVQWASGTEDERLTARACGLVFLLNKVADENKELGLKCTSDTLADLLVEDLTTGSAALRARLPKLLDGCELLMKVKEQYRIQTEESAAWNDEFLNQRSTLANDSARVSVERGNRLRAAFAAHAGKLTLPHGDTKVTRNLQVSFDSHLPSDSTSEVYLWVRDGWLTDESSVRADARLAGATSATVFIFVPRYAADELRNNLMDAMAAAATLDHRGVPLGPEATEAKAAMETTRQAADDRIMRLLGEALSAARVFQGGGNEIQGVTLQDIIRAAVESALKRLYPRFVMGDHEGWAKVYQRAQKGAPDSLKAVGWNSEAAENPVCKELLGAIGAGKSGADIRERFRTPPYGWSDDAIDGALQALLVAGAIRAQDERKKAVVAVDLERKAIGKAFFKVESTTITVPQRLQARKLFQKLGVHSTKPEEDAIGAPQFVDKLFQTAEGAGGDAPKPATPDTAGLNELKQVQGNELLLMLYNRHAELSDLIDRWQNTAGAINARWAQWLQLERLVVHATSIDEAAPLIAQAESIRSQRLLLQEPDPSAPVVAALSQLLRNELGEIKTGWARHWKAGEELLAHDPNWNALEPEQRHALRGPRGLVLDLGPKIEVDTPNAILSTLDAASLQALKDRIAAMPSRYSEILVASAQLLEPAAHKVTLPSRTLKTEADVKAWVEEVESLLTSAIKEGPVIL